MKILKYVLGAILCVAVVGTANADSAITRCGYLADLAEVIMTGRQQGVAAREFLEFPNNPFPELIEEIVLDAYGNYNRVSSQAAQDRVVREFSNDWYIMCLEVARGR